MKLINYLKNQYYCNNFWKKIALFLFACFSFAQYWAYRNEIHSLINRHLTTKDFSQVIDADDFIIKLISLKTDKIPTSKTASVHLHSELSSKLNILEQRYDFLKIWNENNLKILFGEFEPFLDLNGGIKQHFHFDGNQFIFATFKRKSDDLCHFASLINLTKK